MRLLGVYGAPEVLLRLSVIPERLIHGNVVEKAAFSHFEASVVRGTAPEVYEAESV